MTDRDWPDRGRDDDAATASRARAAPTPSRDIADLIALMAALRDPRSGCPWDLEQSFETISPYTVEEAYEVADAIARGDLDDLRDELGDLLLQVVFHARLAEEQAAFDFGSVVEAITSKLIRRHPHVFGEARELSPAAVKLLWDEIKRGEREARGSPRASALDGVPLALPALTRAGKLAGKAAGVGFTWSEPTPILDKVSEELSELRQALADGETADVADELGDVLFTLANLARHLGLDPEAALAGTNRKFERRFRYLEEALAAEARRPQDATLAEMDRLWDEAKRREAAVRRPSRPEGSG